MFTKSRFVWLLLLLWGGLLSNAWAGLNIQKWQTSAGATVLFVPTHDLPIVDVNVGFVAGAMEDDPARSGLAALTNRMLLMGAGSLDENAMSLALADIGAGIAGRFDQERAGLGLRTLSSARERERAFDLLALSLQQPRFDAAVLEREKARMLAALKEAEALPGEVAAKAFQQAVFGTHPYALPADGTKETLPRLSRQDVEAFYRAHYQARHAVITVIGDLERVQVEALAEQLTRALPVTDSVPGVVPPVADLPAGQIRHIPHPSAQSHILLGQPGMRRDDPDYFPLLVGNYILGGGGFDSRLIKTVRDAHGLAYSAYSYFSPMQQSGPFVMGLQTKNASAAEAVRLVRGELQKFIAEGPTAAELKQAKANIAGSFPLRLDSNKKILGYLSVIGEYNLPLDWLDTYPQKVEAVTLQQIRDAFRRRVHPDRLVEVVVGGSMPAVSDRKADTARAGQ